VTAANLEHYWSGDFLAVNGFIALNLLGALLLGLLVGYERSYRGRAAGMRTFGLVCMASAALTVFVGEAHYWYGGAGVPIPADATRVVQGIVTGIGFLGAGVIVKDGINVTGLTTAASIWAASAIGVLVGVGFYPAALTLALLCMASMSLLRRLEERLPGRATLDVSLSFRRGSMPQLDDVARNAARSGYHIVRSSLIITYSEEMLVWRFAAVAFDRAMAIAPSRLAQELATSEDVGRFMIAPVRN
jgi:putative Mg2+ transporter-C (MgtC) family protein